MYYVHYPDADEAYASFEEHAAAQRFASDLASIVQDRIDVTETQMPVLPQAEVNRRISGWFFDY